MCGLPSEWLVDREAPRPPRSLPVSPSFDVGWADQPGAIEMMLSPSRHIDSPPASPIRGTEAMLLLDLPTRLDAGFATFAMADRPPSIRLAGGDR